MARMKSEPTLLDRIAAVHPKYAALLTKQRELLDRQAALHSELGYGSSQTSRLERTADGEKISVSGHISLAEQARRATLSWVAQLPKPKPKQVARHEGAVALVGELLSPQAPEELSPPPPPQNWPGENRYREIGRELEAIQEALSLLVPEIEKERRSYSKLVVKRRGDEYRETAEAVVDAARVLGAAIQTHHEWITDQRWAGVAYSMYRPLNLERFGNIDEPGSPLLRTILDAVEQKHVGAGKIPDWKMPADIALFQGGN